MRKKVADKKEVQAFLTKILRDEAADVKDRLKVSECLLKLADEDEEKSTGSLDVKIRMVE
ncbi:MAG: hypothetical protein IJN74_01075 [Clostridia bacterium]|nr:hypothetical protein [Clostridia bacterium]